MDDKRTIAQRHADEWEAFRRDNLNPARAALDEKQIKAVKTLADCLRLTQDGERRAHDFGQADAGGRYEIGWQGEEE